MQVICTARDRRAKVLRGDIPFDNGVIMLKQGLIKCLDRERVGKIYGNILVGIWFYKLCQQWMSRNELIEFIAPPVLIAGMQEWLLGKRPAFIRFHHAFPILHLPT